MITEIATVDLLNTAIDKIDDGKIADAKDDLITFRDKIQNEIDQFDKWAEVQSDIDTSIQLEVDKALGKYVMYYSQELQNANPGVSRCVPGIEKAVKSILFTGLTFGTICGILINLN